MGAVDTAVDAAGKFEQLGIIAVLFLVIIALGYLYLKERKKNDQLTERLLLEVSENSKVITEALVTTEKTIDGFKETLIALRAYICQSRRN